MKNKFINNIIRASVAGGMFLSFTLTAGAVGTWTSPTGAPPTNNVDTPINVGNTMQRKVGPLEIGNPSSATPNGLAVYGQSALKQKVTIGIVPCSGIGCYSGSFDTSSTSTYSGTSGAGGGTTGGGTTTGGGSGTAGGTTGGSYTTGGWLVPKIAGNTEQVGFLASLKNAFSNTFKPQPVYAVGTTPECGHSYDYAGSPCSRYSSTGVYLGPGICVWNDTGSLYCSAGTGGGSGGVGSGTTGTTTATLVSDPVISFVPTTSTISSGSTGSIVWSVSNASTCAVGSANPSNNWTPSSVSVSSSTHAGSGTKSLGTFTNPGSYSYYMTCSSPSGGSNSVTATITVGPTYILETYGNANINGYLNATANIYATGFKQNGIDVCLKNGTNCPGLTAGSLSSLFGPYPKITSDMTNEYAVYGANPASGGGNRVHIAGSTINLGTSVTSPAMSVNGDSVSINGTSNRNNPLLQINSTGSSNGDNSAGTERGLTIAASSAAGQGRLLYVKKGTSPLFEVNGNGNVYASNKLITGSFQMATGAGNKKVFVSDASGNGNWYNSVAVYRAGHSSSPSSCGAGVDDLLNKIGPLTMNAGTCGNSNTQVGWMLVP